MGGEASHDRAGGGVEAWRKRPSIASFAPTLCRILGIPPPSMAQEPPLDWIVDSVRSGCAASGRPLERCLIYCPDALGEQAWDRWPGSERAILRFAPIEARLLSVEPPKTPVCYASIFTGAFPETHGIRTYERPVVRCDTLFDALLRAGRRVTIAAVANCSIDLIFRERDLRYSPGRDDAEVTQHVSRDLGADAADVIVAYHQEYDDLLHDGEPFSPGCFAALARHLESFETLCEIAREAWRGRNSLVAFVPDHGAHVDPVTGRGTHGESIPQDLLVRHWYGVLPARVTPGLPR